MDTDTLTSVLQDAGLSPYQADAYVTLLEVGSASASEVAEASGVPGPRIYDVLRTLEEKGYIETYEQGTLRARAHDPSEMLVDLQTRMERLSGASEEIEERWERPAPDSNEVSIVKRFQTVLDRTRSFIRGADYQVQLSISQDQFEEFRSLLAETKERGVHVQLSIHTAPEEPLRLTEEELASVCTEARSRKRTAPFVAIVDQTKVAYALHVDSTNEYGVLVDDRTHAHVFHWFYLTSLWELWEPLYEESVEGPTREYLSIRQCLRDVEPLVADGATVDAHVEGYMVGSRRPVALDGTITDVRYDGKENIGPNGPDRLLHLAGLASLVLETDEGTYTIGGFGAKLEDIEGRRIVVESVRDGA